MSAMGGLASRLVRADAPASTPSVRARLRPIQPAVRASLTGPEPAREPAESRLPTLRDRMAAALGAPEATAAERAPVIGGSAAQAEPRLPVNRQEPVTMRQRLLRSAQPGSPSATSAPERQESELEQRLTVGAVVVSLDEARARADSGPTRNRRARPAGLAHSSPTGDADVRPFTGRGRQPARGTIDPAAKGERATRNPETTGAPARAGPPPGAPPMPRAPPSSRLSAAPVAASDTRAMVRPAGGQRPEPQEAERRRQRDQPEDHRREAGTASEFLARVQRAATRAARHQTGKAGAATAQGASAPDRQRDIDSQAGDAHLQDMSQQQPGPFQTAAFKLRVQQMIASMAPPTTLVEADAFAESGRAGSLVGEIQAMVATGQSASQHDIKVVTEIGPSTEGLTPKPVSRMVNDQPAVSLPSLGAVQVIPGPRPAEMTDLSSGPAAVDTRMTAGGLTPEQLASSNEPSFTAVLDAREEVRARAASSPVDYRVHEEFTLSQARDGAQLAEVAGLQGLDASRSSAIGRALTIKDSTRVSDQKHRDEVAGTVLTIHQRTEDDVATLLSTLSEGVDRLFTEGEKVARSQFEQYVEQQMAAYKAVRYGGALGAGYWLRDRFLDLPDEVNDFYRDGRATYLNAMDRVIDAIALVVSFLLNAARRRIAIGRDQVRDYLSGLHGSLAQVGRATADQLDTRFDVLQADIDAKCDELVDTVAHRAADATTNLNQRIAELKEQNKGLVSRAIDFVEGVINTVQELGSLLARLLVKAVSAIDTIIAHPIRFLGHLVDAVGGGLDRFVSRIGRHLEDSLLDLLFGELGSSGITLPKRLDLSGIFDLVVQVLGLTYTKVRDRLVRQFGEPFVAGMERVAGLFVTLVHEGLAGVWEVIQPQIGNLHDLVIGKIKEYIVERVVKAGVGYIGALLTPVGAFIKACQGIYQIISFVVERARQLASFVDSVIESIATIAEGDVAAAAERIENALASGLNLVIGFLARLANLGAISEQIRAIIEALRAPVTRAVDAIIFPAARAFHRTAGPMTARARAGAASVVRSGRDLLGGRPDDQKQEIAGAPTRRERETAGPGADRGAGGTPAEAALPAAGGHLVIHQEFRSDGHRHEIYTGTDGRQLILASETPPTPITVVPDPTGELNRLHTRYLAARQIYDRSLAAIEADPRASPGVGRHQKAVNEVVLEIVARIRQLRPDDSPGASAPGIGDVRRHGRQQTSLREDTAAPRVWALESEHLMPFAVGKMLWDTVGSAVPARQGAEDEQQTTVMIYVGAANRKTPIDRSMIDDFKSQYIGLLAPAATRLRRFLLNQRSPGMHSRAHEDFAHEFHRALAGLNAAASMAVGRTETAVRDEHGAPDASGQTNGARRAEPVALPPGGTIRGAAEQQRLDVLRLATVAAEQVIDE
jgi:phage-related protein